MEAFFHTILYTPIYNLLVFLIGIIPGGDVGIALIVVTVIVKLIIAPLSISALRTQRNMKAIEPEMKAIKEQFKGDKEGEARETFALYKKYGINPFASIAAMLIQLPIIICLYWVLRTDGLPAINSGLLYSFVHAPTGISMLFLGIFTVAGHSILLALIAAAFQFVQARYTIPSPPKAEPGKQPSMQEELGRTMALQARFILPILIGFIAYASGGIALYFITSSVTSIIQEFYIRRQGLRA